MIAAVAGTAFWQASYDCDGVALEGFAIKQLVLTRDDEVAHLEQRYGIAGVWLVYHDVWSTEEREVMNITILFYYLYHKVRHRIDTQVSDLDFKPFEHTL